MNYSNYRAYLLNLAEKTGDHALANLAKLATGTTLENLYVIGYKMTAVQVAEARIAYFMRSENDRPDIIDVTTTCSKKLAIPAL
jgi:hypothetical protein